MKQGLIFFSLLSICILSANFASAKSLTEELRELYVKRSKGIVTQSEFEKQREKLKTNPSQTNGSITTPQEIEESQSTVETGKTEANFDHSSFKSDDEQRKFKELIKKGNFEKAIQLPTKDSPAYKMALGFLNLKSNYIPSKVSSDLPNDLSNVSIVIFANKYWKAADMIRLSDDMRISVNGSSFFGKTVDQDRTNGSFITKKFNFQLPKGKHEFTLTCPAERRRAYGNQNDQFGKWCLKNCEFKFSLDVNGPIQEIRVIDFFKKAGTMGNYVVGEKFHTRTEYDSLLAKRRDQEKDENNTQAFCAALAIVALAANSKNSEYSYPSPSTSLSSVPSFQNQSSSQQTMPSTVALQTKSSYSNLPKQNVANFWQNSPMNYDNSPMNYDNSPMNYNNSPINFENSPTNYKNSSMNYNNSITNYKNSEMNYDNSPMNYKNSPLNYDNSPLNPNRRSIIDSSGNSSGYAVPQKDGGFNLFDNAGNRIGYSPDGSRGVFDNNGQIKGYAAPKKNCGYNLYPVD